MGVEWIVGAGVALYVVALLLARLPVCGHQCVPCDDERRRKNEDRQVWEHKAWHRHWGDDQCPYCKRDGS